MMDGIFKAHNSNQHKNMDRLLSTIAISFLLMVAVVHSQDTVPCGRTAKCLCVLTPEGRPGPTLNGCKDD
ncbi:hypothetical protein PGT21_034645 [Puccinia graminis f. sp. tritici]|uniref:Uncharacterized protein n=1 Tax=Puccinia graminis f. sp. tritici TaxID=56615 RepID=A0A5B0NSL4_PUCGR|nr:hypothetical protein PGT21_034645 [Puccinia graminis f. sp. tritici]